jgi:hypothetical protein
VRLSRDFSQANPFSGAAVGLPTVTPQGTRGLRLRARLHVVDI